MQMRNEFKRYSPPESPPSREEALLLFQRLMDSGVRQERVAADLGVSQGQISKILRGDFQKLQGRPFQVFNYAKEALAEMDHAPEPREQEILQAILSLMHSPNHSDDRLLEVLRALKRFRDG